MDHRCIAQACKVYAGQAQGISLGLVNNKKGREIQNRMAAS